jgi:hypothetical protein
MLEHTPMPSSLTEWVLFAVAVVISIVINAAWYGAQFWVLCEVVGLVVNLVRVGLGRSWLSSKGRNAEERYA